MRTCRDCMNIFYPEDEFDCQDLCPTCRNDEVTIAMVDTKSPCSKTLNQQVKSLKDKIAGLEADKKTSDKIIIAFNLDTIERSQKLKELEDDNKCLKQEAIEAYDIIVELKAEQNEARLLENFVLSFIDLKPEHPLYKSIREDIKGSLARLKTGEAKPHSEVEKLKAKLEKYGGHTQQCALNFHPLNTQCTCGWKKS